LESYPTHEFGFDIGAHRPPDGLRGLPHTRLPEASHFLRDDQGAEIARRIVELMEST
jgi:hypothetical protein